MFGSAHTNGPSSNASNNRFSNVTSLRTYSGLLLGGQLSSTSALPSLRTLTATYLETVGALVGGAVDWAEDGWPLGGGGAVGIGALGVY